MIDINFTVYGSPKAQPRTKARSFTAHGRTFASVYNPAGKSRQWKTDIKVEAIKHKPPSLILGPVILTVHFFLTRPDTLYRKKDHPGAIPHPKKPDIDNLYKLVADALEGILWKNDSQIFDASIFKWYHEIDKGPRVNIRVSEV